MSDDKPKICKECHQGAGYHKLDCSQRAGNSTKTVWTTKEPTVTEQLDKDLLLTGEAYAEVTEDKELRRLAPTYADDPKQFGEGVYLDSNQFTAQRSWNQTVWQHPVDRPRTLLKWNRVGSHYRVDDLDVTTLVDLKGLEAKVQEVVNGLLSQPCAVELQIRVVVNGGPYFQLPFGSARVELDLPKAKPKLPPVLGPDGTVLD